MARRKIPRTGLAERIHQMAYNYKHENCNKCRTFVAKGDGKWLAWPFHHTLCKACYNIKFKKTDK